jgi:putative PIN family toxin of toxin-antitoxin system
LRIIVDTNVLMSAILFGGTPARILQAWREATVGLVMSPEIIDEYVRVAERLSARYPGVDVQRILALIVQNGEVVQDSLLPVPVCEDPDDDKFLACAVAANVEVIVSGDKKLRAVSGYAGIRVVTPRQFVDESI